MYGGSSAAKTYSISQGLTIDGYANNYNSIVFRKEQSNIKDTIKNDFTEILESLNLSQAHQVQEFKINNVKGGVIRFRGLDNSGKAKGLKGYKKIYCDELDHFTQDDWKEFQRRLRGQDGQQILASWNPVSSEHWIKEYLNKIEFSDLPKVIEGNPYSQLDKDSRVQISKDGRTILIKTTYKDNKWIVGGEINGKTYGRIDSQVLDEFEEMKSMYPSDYMIYALGEWGTFAPDNPFFPHFDREYHVYEKQIKPSKNIPLWLSFDFNYDPCTCIVAGVYEESYFIFETIQIVGGTDALCDVLNAKGYNLENWYNIFATGDTSGFSRSSVGGNITDFDIIKKKLNLRKHNLRFNGKRNSTFDYSFKVINHALAKLPILINPKGNDKLINDLIIGKRSKDGKLFKDRSKGHGQDAGDAFRYLIHVWFPQGVKEIERESKRFEAA